MKAAYPQKNKTFTHIQRIIDALIKEAEQVDASHGRNTSVHYVNNHVSLDKEDGGNSSDDYRALTRIYPRHTTLKNKIAPEEHYKALKDTFTVTEETWVRVKNVLRSVGDTLLRLDEKASHLFSALEPSRFPFTHNAMFRSSYITNVQKKEECTTGSDERQSGNMGYAINTSAGPFLKNVVVCVYHIVRYGHTQNIDRY